jgi:hypothetical protein
MKYSLRSLTVVMVATPPVLGGCYWFVKLYPQALPFVALLLSFAIAFLGNVACKWELASIAREGDAPRNSPPAT